jgi:hypothetical protein
MFRSVFEWHTLKTIAVVALVSVGVVALAVAGFVGVLFYKAYVPERVSVTGRVTDSGGKPIKGIEVHAVPLPIHDPYSESAMEPKDTQHTAVSDENGRYRFKGLVAAGGVKEGMWVQEYDVVVNADGFTPKEIRFRKPPRSRQAVIRLADLVLEEERPISAIGTPGS